MHPRDVIGACTHGTENPTIFLENAGGIYFLQDRRRAKIGDSSQRQPRTCQLVAVPASPESPLQAELLAKKSQDNAASEAYEQQLRQNIKNKAEQDRKQRVIDAENRRPAHHTTHDT